jgi:TRAP-type transport system periplasmic protein
MRKLLGWSAIGVGLSAYCAAAAAAETLTVSNGLPPTHVVSTHGFDPWMACVEEATQGEVDFNHFPSGQIAAVGESLNALEIGLADVAFTSSTNESSKLPLNNMANLPGFGQTLAEKTAAYRTVVDKGP